MGDDVLDPRDYTVAWLAPLQVEALAAIHMLDKIHEGHFEIERGDDYVFTAGDINGHNVIIATFPGDHDYGVGSAAALASQVRKTFRNLWIGLLVGVAAGLPRHDRDIRLGDVIVGVGNGDNAGIVSYGLGKETEEGFQVLHNGHQPKTETIIRSAIRKIELHSAVRGNTFLQYYDKFKDLEHDNWNFLDPGPERDELYQVVKVGDIVETRLVPRIPRTGSKRTRVWYGSIGSGDRLMKNAQKRDELRDRFNLIGLEMEGAGIMSTIPVGVIRGVSDYGDGHKSKKWQPYAAAMAAAYAKQVLYTISPAIRSLTQNMSRDSEAKSRKILKRQQQTFTDQMPDALEVSKIRQIALRSLSFSEADKRLNTIHQANQDTCDWFFESPDFEEWRDRKDFGKNNGVLWIRGKPGAGKSTLMKHTFNYCKKTFQDHIITAYFFNARGNTLEKTPLGMQLSFVYQLIDGDNGIRDLFLPLVREKIKKHGTELDHCVWHEGELKDFLLNLVRNHQPKPLLFLVDALDECIEDQVRETVKFLESLSIEAARFNTRISICLSSRHYPTIDMEKKIKMNVEEQEDHDDDIRKYVWQQLKTADSGIRAEILYKSAHVFLWVVLVVEILNKAYDEGDIWNVRDKLHEIPAELGTMFLEIIAKDNPSKPVTLLMLQWVLFSRESLSPEQLYFGVLAGIYPEKLCPRDQSQCSLNTIKLFITSTSRGLVEVRYYGGNTFVQFIHQSVPDFLLRNQIIRTLDPMLDSNIIGTSHDRLASCCMSYIGMQELEPLLLGSVQTLSSREDEIARKFPLLKYASVGGLLYHAEEAQSNGIHQDTLIQQFYDLDILERLKRFHDAGEVRINFEYGDCRLLYILSLEGCLQLLRVALLDGNADVNIEGGALNTALQAAAYKGHEEIVILLLDRGAKVNAQGGGYGIALQAAVYHGNEKIVTLLLEKGAEINTQGGKYGTALQAAAVRGNENLVTLLLEEGAEVNAQGGEYSNALLAAAVRGNENIVTLLLEKGAEVNTRSWTLGGGALNTSLQAAAFRGHEKIIKLLLEKGRWEIWHCAPCSEA